MDTKEFATATIMNFVDKVEYSAEGIVSKRIIQRDKGSVSLFAFDKDQQLSEHTAPFDALIQVLEGTGEVIINKKSYILKPGQSIIMPANIPHAVNAVEKFKMLLTMIKGE